MSIELPPYRPVKQRSGLAVMAAAIHALFMRELQTRFGGYRLGYLWAIIEPGMQILLFVLIVTFLRTRSAFGIDYSVFLVGGIVIFFAFRKSAMRSLSAVDANKGLLSYRPIRPFDTMLSRLLLEFIMYFFVFILFVLGLVFFDKTVSFSHLDLVLACWLSMFVFTMGISLIIMVIGHYSKEVGKLFSLVFYVLYFASGVLFPILIVPEPYLTYLLYNPLIHNLEMLRHALAPTYPSFHIDFWYFLKSTLAVLFFGFVVYTYAEKDMMRSQ